MPRVIDLTGRIFGDLEVIEKVEKRKASDPVLWLCRCACNGEREVRTGDLTGKRVTHCGCKSASGIQLGQTFTFLTVKEYTDKRSSDGKRLWRCECKCGGEKFVTSTNLKKGHTKSCGCLNHVSKVKVNDRFGSLTVLRYAGSNNGKGATFLCRCDCGRETCVREKVYPATFLIHGQATSCRSSATPDLSNKRFGHVKVLCPSDKRSSGGNIMWECECDCGEIIYRTHSSLKAGGQNTNCGCLQSELSRETFSKTVHHVNDTCIEKIKSQKTPANNKSGVRGVMFNWRNQKWRAYIGFQKKQINLGEYNSLEEATEIRKKAESEIYKPFLESYYNNSHSNDSFETFIQAIILSSSNLLVSGRAKPVALFAE